MKGTQRVSRINSAVFLPDLFDIVCNDIEIISSKLDEKTLIKCHVSANTIIVKNNFSIKRFRENMEKHINPIEKIIFLAKSRALLMDQNPEHKPKTFTENYKINTDIIQVISYQFDQLLLTNKAQILELLGLNQYNQYFSDQKINESGADDLSTLISEIISSRTSMVDIITHVDKFINNAPKQLEDVIPEYGDQAQKIVGLINVIVNRIREEPTRTIEQTSVISYFDIVNHLLNITSLIRITQENLIDMEDNLSINFSEANQYVIKEIATMADIDKYRNTALKILFKNLRCYDVKIKISVLNRIITTVNSLNDSFFKDPSKRNNLGVKLRDVLQSMIDLEKRSNQFISKRLR